MNNEGLLAHGSLLAGDEATQQFLKVFDNSLNKSLQLCFRHRCNFRPNVAHYKPRGETIWAKYYSGKYVEWLRFLCVTLHT